MRPRTSGIGPAWGLATALALMAACGGRGAAAVDLAVADVLAAADVAPDRAADADAPTDAPRADPAPQDALDLAESASDADVADPSPDAPAEVAVDIAPDDPGPPDAADPSADPIGEIPPADAADAAAEGVTDAAGDSWATGVPPGAGVPFQPTGFFHVERHPDRWWLVTPDGSPFYSIGVTTATPDGEQDRTTGANPYATTVASLYATRDDWADATVARLKSWGFNTAGAWCATDLFAPRMPYTVILDIGGADWLAGTVPDWFDPAFEQRCADIATSQVAPRATDPNLVGWFLDNEMHWGPDWRTTHTLLDDYLALPAGAPGQVEALKYGTDDKAFLTAVATRYFQVATRAVRAADPNHLVLGVRVVSVLTLAAVVDAAGPWVDVFSVNRYAYIDGLEEALQESFGAMPAGDALRGFWEHSGRPILVSEFGFRAADSGLPNSYPPMYPTYATQSDRADAFESWATQFQGAPWIVGQHWFQWCDEPAGGRFDGEDDNWGLVNAADQPYDVLTQRMAAVHALAP